MAIEPFPSAVPEDGAFKTLNNPDGRVGEKGQGSIQYRPLSYGELLNEQDPQ